MKQPDLGLKIIELRQSKGLTQEELVKQCNLSVRTLQRIESGDVEPRGFTLRLISKVLDFDFFSLSQGGNDLSETLKSDNTCNLRKIRDILITRYASLNNSSVDNIKSKLEDNSIETIIQKHNRMISLSIALVFMLSSSLLFQFFLLYKTNSFSFPLILTVLLLIVFLKGMHDNYEIKHILKILKEIE